MITRDAHRELAYSLGDPVIIDNNTVNLPDGVRFSTALRNSYLNRAILQSYRLILQQLNNIPKETRKTYIQRSFPNSIVFEGLSLNSFTDANGISLYYDDLTYRSQEIINLIGYSNFNNGPIPIPLKDNPQKIQGLYNSRSVQEVDAFGIYSENSDVGRIDIYDPKNEISVNCDVAYLPVPLHPKDQGLNDNLMIDDIYMNQIIKLATLYGKLDSQDIEDVSMYSPQL